MSLDQDQWETTQPSFVDVNQLGAKDAFSVAAKAGKNVFMGWHRRVNDSATEAVRRIRERTLEAED